MLQNLLLLGASYFFYSFANLKILPIFVITSLVFYWLGIVISKSRNKRNRFLYELAGILFGLGALLYFKYSNFFISSFSELLETMGFNANLHTLKIIVPLGISFYTFRLLSYIIDIYRGKYEPARDIVGFLTYVAFFPCILSGPIDRPDAMLPQLAKKRVFDYQLAVSGMRQILWGLFKKAVIADFCNPLVNNIFNNYGSLTASSLVIGAVLYAIELYSDFSGYTDMAVGIGKLLGFRIAKNFNYPYFATSFADYWKRNHISLTTWFMDYIYYPLVDKSDKLWYWNLCMIITFILSGFWHGVGWNFVLWGLYQGIFIVISMNIQKSRKRFEKKHNLKNNAVYQWFAILLTFAIVSFGLIFFRADSLQTSFGYIARLFSSSLLSPPNYMGKLETLLLLIFIIPMFIVEWKGRNDDFGIEKLFVGKNVILRWSFYCVLFLTALYSLSLSDGAAKEFIYFKF
jgi:D-alanyl-lipoteichoic acid acyltransferase DltB (MBOAT superfamily)